MFSTLTNGTIALLDGSDSIEIAPALLNAKRIMAGPAGRKRKPMLFPTEN
ncbi:hypothetical protein [Mesorhizobium sp. M1A.F.Ca.IN.022.02.1.1]|nr:hypothetical protein [Mesorhizobium sp. M1A.F.Ca.IN.022.02.1.1]